MELVEFLLARIGEDEAVAQRNSGSRGLGDDGFFPDYRTYQDEHTRAADEFIGHFAPRRVLAECAAKRRIVERFANFLRETSGDEPEGAWELLDDHAWSTLYDLAQPYASHPDYDPAWNPEATQ